MPYIIFPCLLILSICMSLESSKAGSELAAGLSNELESSAIEPAPVSASFVPQYYSEILKIDGQSLRLNSQSKEGQTQQLEYTDADGNVRIIIQHTPCDRVQCDALFNETFQKQNLWLSPKQTQAIMDKSTGHGKFLSVLSNEFVSIWQENAFAKADFASNLAVFSKLPNGILIWTRFSEQAQKLEHEPYLTNLRAALNRQRYEEAMKLGNVEKGRWADSSYQYARHLLSHGQISEALKVLKHVIVWAPFHLNAHLDFAENSPNERGRASALAVWENTENPQMRARAAIILDRKEMPLASFPLLSHEMRGLQVVLVPLPPCDIQLLEEAGRLYTKSFQVPVQIARLPKEWVWNRPDRIYGQRDLQRTILGATGRTIDFAGWSKERYAKELRAVTATGDAATQYSIESFLEEASDKMGQYQSEPYVDQMIEILKALHVNDARTMVVGVTSANIYMGDTNFVFSVAGGGDGIWGSILSYALMQADTLGESYHSRGRLVERLTKELVPASLKQLNIPRPADPRDPFSYSGGVARLDQKTLTLSTPTREFLDRYRSP
ncbi:MAG: hypothetical protein JKY45_03350 [Emcibacter sp.]|nr:hypothetical protein [Emcibacter sp.]